MDVETLQEEMRKLSSMIDGWDSPQRVSEIERDLVLEKLRTLYEAVYFFELSSTETMEADTSAEFDLGIDFPLDVLSLDEPQGEDSIPRSEPESKPELVPEATPVLVTEPESEPEPESLSESEHLPDAESAPEPVSEAELRPDAEPEEQAGVEEPEAEAEAEAEAEVSEEERKSIITPTLFGLEPDEDMLRHRRKQRVIMSLYHDQPVRSEVGASAECVTTAAQEQPEVELVAEQTSGSEHASTAGYAAEPADEDPFGSEDPFEEISLPKTVGEALSGVVLGDVINHDKQTLADTFAPQRDRDLRRGEQVDDLRRAIGLNDRFLLVRDLFDGDGDACDTALETLNGCESLDDCMIYIAENYVWNPNSDGAKLLMELIERKFL